MSYDNPEIRLTLNSVEYRDWISYEIENSLLEVPSAFSFTTDNRYAEKTATFREGGYVQILIDGEAQLWGWIDSVDLQGDESGAHINVSGRDIFSFLADSDVPKKHYRNKTLLQIAEDIAGDWVFDWQLANIISADLPVIKGSGVKVQPGDKPLSVLQKWAEKHKVIAWCHPDGTGRIGRPNYNQEPLYNLYRYGRKNTDKYRLNNIISGGAQIGFDERYSEVAVYGQSSGNIFEEGGRYKATAFDTSVSATRRLTVNDSDCKNRQQTQNKADLEVDRRKFDGEILNYTVKGHYGQRSDGKGGVVNTLWQINTLVDVEDEFAGASGRYIIVRRRFTGDENGRHTELELRPVGLWLA